MDKLEKDKLQIELIQAFQMITRQQLKGAKQLNGLDRLQATIAGAYSALYREGMSERVKRGIAERKKRLDREAKDNRNTDCSN